MAVRGNCDRWFVIALSLCLVLGPIRAQSSVEGANTSTPSCNDEYLITVENTTQGITVNVLNKHNNALQYQKFEGRYLSSQCGDHYFRCQDLFIVSSTSTVKNKTLVYHIVFVPLRDGILLLKYLYNGASLSKTDDYFLGISFGCSPTLVSEISENIFTVCLNEETRNVTVLRVYLNSSSIKDSHIGRPLVTFNGLSNPPHLSDFKYVNSDTSNPNDQQIIFASSKYLYGFAPLSYLHYPLGLVGNCSSPESLVYYVPNDEVLVYCRDDSAVYFSLSHPHTINQTGYSKHGQPFLCPNPDVRITVFASASYVQYTVWSNNSRENFNIHDMKFDSGVCIGSTEHTLFAYNDKDKGVYVLDPATSNLTHLSSKACLNSHCEPLLVFQNRYIVIRERENNDGNVIVVDSQQNYTAVITAEHVKADLLTLLIEQDASFCSLTNGSLSPTGSTPTVSPPSVPGTQIAGPAAGVSVGLVVVLVVCSVIVIIVRKRRQRKKSRSVYSQATSDIELESQSSELQSDCKSNDQQQGEAERPVRDGHDKGVACTSSEDDGKPAFQQLPHANQVYEASTAENPPVNQQNDSYTQGSSDVNQCSTDSPSTPDHETGGGAASSKRQQSAATSNIHQQDSRSQQARASVHSDKEASEKPTPSDTSGVVISATTASQPIKASDSKLTAVGDVLSSKDISGATANAAPEQASGSKQTGVRVSTTTPNCVFSPNKPDGLNQNTYLPSAESDLFRHDKEWLLQPKSEESKDHECESCDEHVPGRCNVVLSRKSPKQEKKQKRAEGGNYKQL